MKRALVTGITGQAGHYITKLLLREGYEVIGLKRRNSTTENEYRLRDFKNSITLECGDVTDISTIISLLKKYKPKLFFNFAAQSHVWVSFKEPLHTFDVTAKGTLNCLEALKLSGLDCKFFQASSSEMFGSNVSFEGSLTTDIFHKDYNNLETFEKKHDFFQNEETPFNPKSPYAIAKLAAHNYCNLYRKSYGMWISCGIMGNYESPYRGEEFVTRKITKYLAKTFNNDYIFPKLKLGNVDSYRDWTYAEDTMEAVMLMMRQNTPGDYVIGTGETRSVKEFIEACASFLIEKGFKRLPTDFYEIDSTLYRPSEVPYLKMDSSKIRKLGWQPKCSFEDLVAKMMLGDIL